MVRLGRLKKWADHVAIGANGQGRLTVNLHSIHLQAQYTWTDQQILPLNNNASNQHTTTDLHRMNTVTVRLDDLLRALFGLNKFMRGGGDSLVMAIIPDRALVFSLSLLPNPSVNGEDGGVLTVLVVSDQLQD